MATKVDSVEYTAVKLSASAKYNAVYRYSFDDCDDGTVSDDPPWYNAPKDELQAALPEEVLKKHKDLEIYPRHSNGDSFSCDSTSSNETLSSSISPAGDSDTDTESLENRRVKVNSFSSSDFSESNASESDSTDVAMVGKAKLKTPDRVKSKSVNFGANEQKQTRPNLKSTEVIGSRPSRAESLAAYLLEEEEDDDEEDGLSPLLRAAKKGNVKRLQICLDDRTTNITERDSIHGQTALHYAVRFGNFECVKLLCDKKYRKILVDAVDTRLNASIHLAAAKSRRITRYLVEEASASVNKANSRDQTPLVVHILTAKTDDPTLAELLLQYGANAKARVNDSYLVHVALDNDLPNIAAVLVQYGARLDVKDAKNRTVFDRVNRKVLKQLINSISFPPVWIPDLDRETCMTCSRKFNRFGIGIRRHHCRLCGRLCCGRCTHVTVDSTDFPDSIQQSICKRNKFGGATTERVCNTCHVVVTERIISKVSKKTRVFDFVQTVLGCSWEERHVQDRSSARHPISRRNTMQESQKADSQSQLWRYKGILF